MSLKARVETITPKMATLILDNHNEHNRPKSDSYVRRLANDMKNGRWMLTHQGLGFNCDGSLIDGQNRLAAVVLCGKPQKFLVVRGVSKAASAVIDGGRKRNVRDALRIVHGVEMSTRAVSCCLYIDSRGQLTRLLPAERVDVCLRYGELAQRAEILFNCKTPGITRANVLAVIARALETHKESEIAHFCEVLATGQMRSGRDKTVTLLRDWLMTRVAGQGGAGTYHREAYMRTETALSAWLRRESLTRIRPSFKELFLLSGEQEEVETPEAAANQTKTTAKAKGPTKAAA